MNIEKEIAVDEEIPKCPDCGAPLEMDFSSVRDRWICERCGYEYEESEY
jgi:ribosomal protein S27AE